MIQVLAKVALALASVMLVLVAAELLVRATYVSALDLSNIEPWRDQRLAPPLNEIGFREEPLDATVMADGVTRILFLGDSFTFGQGVEGKNRFSDLVEDRLNRERPGLFHVYNAGIPASSPENWFRALKKLMPDYRPDLVLAVFFLRGGIAIGTSLRFHEERINSLKARYDAGLLSRHSKLVAAIGDRLATRDFTEWYLNQFHLAYLGDLRQTGMWRFQQGRLAKIKRYCERRGVQFRMSIFPLLYELNDYEFDSVEREITRFADSAGIPIMSLTPGFLGRNERELWLSPSDQHPNERGHAIAAETLYPYVAEALDGLER